MGRKKKTEIDPIVNEADTLLSQFQEETTVELNQVIAEDIKDDKVNENDRPSLGDPEWTKYALDQLTEDELDKGLPKTDGLRRIAWKLFGSFDSYTTIVDPPRAENQGRATVHVRLQFKEFGVDGAADVCNLNTDYKFARHPVATAETRAEGRALRKALKLVKIITVEEANAPENAVVDVQDLAGKSVTDVLQVMAEKAGINLIETILSMGINKPLDSITKDEAIKVSDEIVKIKKETKAAEKNKDVK